MKFFAPLLLLVVIGCGSSKSVVGSWSMNAPFGTMMVNFKEDLSYDGNLTGPAVSGAIAGTYEVDGKTLVINPPQVSLPNGTTMSPPGGQMRLKMTWKGDGNIELYNGAQTFMMTRTN